MKLSVEDLLGSAISPKAWLQWIQRDVLDKLPYDTRIMISNINGLWIISNEAHEILWSSEPVELEPVVSYAPSIAAVQLIQRMMAMVSPDPDFAPDDGDGVA